MRLTVPHLLPGTNYSVQVRSTDGKSYSPWGNKYNFTTVEDSNLPATPTNVTWTAKGDSFYGEWDAVTTDISAKVDNITHYELQLTAGSTVKVISVPQNTGDRVSYTLTAARNRSLFGTIQKSVSMQVRAVNSKNLKSAWSTSIQGLMGKPGAPTNAVVVNQPSAVAISWSAPASTVGLAGYHVYASTTSGFTPSGNNLVYTGDSTSFTYYSSTFTTTYFVIRSFDIYGTESDDLPCTGAPQSPFVADTTAPDMPTGLTTSLSRDAQNNAFASVQWSQNPVSDLAGFSVRWRKVGDTTYSIEIVDKGSTSVKIPLPSPYSDYEFSVASFDSSANYSSYTATSTLTGSIPGAPPAPTNVVAKAGRDNISLSWDKSTAGDVIYGGYYTVQIDTVNTFNSANLLSYNTGSTTIAVSGLTALTTYYYRVQAVDSTALTSSWNSSSVTTLGFPTPAPSDGYPPGSSPTPVITPGFGYLNISWPKVTTNSNSGPQSDTVTYEVHISTTSGFTPSSSTKAAEIVGTVTNLKADGSGTALVAGTTYYVATIAKDYDGAAAASTQASGAPLKITGGDINTGTLSASVITLGSGGVIQSSNYDGTGTSPGFSLSQNGLIIRTGTISAGTIESNGTISATGLSITGNMSLSSSGYIQSTNYNTTNKTGFKLTSTGLDVQSGTINAGTLTAGTISANGISIGSGALLTVDATGAVQSNNYASGSTGWKLSSSGLELNSGTVKASALTAGTIGAQSITLGSGGSISSNNYNGSNAGWSLGSTGLTIYNGSISANTITTGQLVSSQNVTVNGTSQPAWLINMSGSAQFGNAQVRGTMVVGTAGDPDAGQSYIQSGNYSPGSTGWKIDSSGHAEFTSATIYGKLATGMSYPRVEVVDATTHFSNGGSAGTASIYMYGGTTAQYQPAIIYGDSNSLSINGPKTASGSSASQIVLYDNGAGNGSQVNITASTIGLGGTVQSMDGNAIHLTTALTSDKDLTATGSITAGTDGVGGVFFGKASSFRLPGMSGSSGGINWGWVSGVPNINGDIAVTHNLGFKPACVWVTPAGQATGSIIGAAWNYTTTTLDIRVYDSATGSAIVQGSARTFYWLAVA